MQYNSIASRDKTWPWDRELPSVIRNSESEASLPRISIVTPSYNQGNFIEETIRSVVLQNYPNLEYFVMDAGSTDGTLRAIQEHSQWITSWVSERDNGQADAVNKGWSQATGEILGWLNSDDLLAPGALEYTASVFQTNADCIAVVGRTTITDRYLNTVLTKDSYRLDTDRILRGASMPGQPSVFIRRSVFETVGGLDEVFHYSLDREYWMRLSRAYSPERFHYTDSVLSIAREYVGNKSSLGGKNQARERLAILDTAFSDPNLPPSLMALRGEAYGRTKLRIAAMASMGGRPVDAWRAAISSWPHHPTLGNLFRVAWLCAKAASPIKRTRRSLFIETSAAPE